MKKNLYLLYGITFLQGMVFYSPVALLYRQEAGLTLFQISVIESVSLFLCFALELPWGILADRIGCRLTMCLCCLFYFISKLIFWKAWTFQEFLLERIFLSISISGLSGADTALLYQYAPREKSQQIFGVYDAMGTGGLMTASICFSLFLGNRWRSAALLTAVAYGLAFLLSLFLERPLIVAAESISPKKAPGIFRNLSFAWKGMFARNPSFFLFLLGAGLLLEIRQYITVFLNQPQYVACGLSPRIIALLYILTQIAGMTGPWSYRLTKKLGIPLFSAFCFLIPASLSLILSFTSSPLCSVVCILGIQGAVSLFQPLQTELQNRQVSARHRAASLSLQAMFLEVTGAVLEPILGFLAQKDIAMAFTAGSLFCVGGFLLCLLYKFHTKN